MTASAFVDPYNQAQVLFTECLRFLRDIFRVFNGSPIYTKEKTMKKLFEMRNPSFVELVIHIGLAVVTRGAWFLVLIVWFLLRKN